MKLFAYINSVRFFTLDFPPRGTLFAIHSLSHPSHSASRMSFGANVHCSLDALKEISESKSICLNVNHTMRQIFLSVESNRPMGASDLFLHFFLSLPLPQIGIAGRDWCPLESMCIGVKSLWWWYPLAYDVHLQQTNDCYVVVSRWWEFTYAHVDDSDLNGLASSYGYAFHTFCQQRIRNCHRA